MFHSLLVPVDGSTRGKEALDAAARLARRAGAELVLLHVQERAASFEVVLETGRDLQRMVAELREQGIAARYRIGYGRPEASIAETATEERADLVVMAPHHRSRIESLRSPSVTARLLSRSPVPILIWPAQDAGRVARTFLNEPGACVLVPLDGSELAEQALPFTAELAGAYGCPPLLVRVVPPVALFGAGPETLQLERRTEMQEAREAEHYLAAVRQRLSRDYGLAAQSMVLRGSPEHELLRVAETHDGSLMVMSTHGRSGISRLLLGSVALQVLRQTPLPLLVVPSRAVASVAQAQEASTVN